MSRSVAICEASLPDDIPNKGQLCRTAGAIDRNISAVSGMLDQLYRRMAALVQTNRAMQARLRRMEQGADPATRQEIQRVRQQYQAAIEGTARVLQDIRRRIKGVKVDSEGGAPPGPGLGQRLLNRVGNFLGGAAGTSAPGAPGVSAAGTSAPGAPGTNPPAPEVSAAGTSAPGAVGTNPPAPGVSAVGTSAPGDPGVSGGADSGLTLTDLVDAYWLFTAVDQPEYRALRTQFINYLTQKQQRVVTQAQLDDITKLLVGLTGPYTNRTAIIQELLNKKLRQDVGGKIVVDLSPGAGNAASKVREIIQMILVAQWGRDGSFVTGNTVASLHELRDAVDQYLTDKNPFARNVFNRGSETNNLLARLTQIDLLHAHPRLADALYKQIIGLTVNDRNEVYGDIQTAIDNVQAVNAASAAKSFSSVGVTGGNIFGGLGRIRANLIGP